MSLSDNLKLRGQHTLFSPSQPSWINYDADEFIGKLVDKFRSDMGTELHSWAYSQIELGHKMTSAKEIIRSFETHIFDKYNDERYGLAEKGIMLLKCVKYITPETIETVKMYVNDAVAFKMRPEIPLKYSYYFGGTCDAIKEEKDFVRIHDLKTGATPAHVEQLLIYEALYCLQEEVDPFSISSELRIYQLGDVATIVPERRDIKDIMDRIRKYDILISKFKGGMM